MELASLAALERSHRRHDEVMAGLLEAARRFAAGRADRDDLDRVHDAVAYFEREVPRHFVDEEGSVFPRLSTRRPALAGSLAEMSAEHPTQITLQAAVAAAAHELDDEARPSAGKALLDAATRLAEAHHAHVGREDEIFANAHEALTAADDREIVAEMERRREREGEARGGTAQPLEPGAPTPRPRATAKLTTKRASVAARSSAKRGPRKASQPSRPASKSGARAASTSASKSTARTAKQPTAKKPTARTVARRPASRAGTKR